MAYNFNNSIPGMGDRNAGLDNPHQAADRSQPVTSGETPTPIPMEPVTSDNPESGAGVRFRSCRWMQPPDNAMQAFCTHREVKPYAGTQGFDAEAWCPECQYYKLRRAPRKRSDDTFSY